MGAAPGEGNIVVSTTGGVGVGRGHCDAVVFVIDDDDDVVFETVCRLCRALTASWRYPSWRWASGRGECVRRTTEMRRECRDENIIED